VVAILFTKLQTGLIGDTDLIRSTLEICPMQARPPALERLGQIEQSAERPAELCREKLAHLDDRLIFPPIDLSTLVSESYPHLQPSISKKAALTLSLAAGLPAIHADLTQLRQVLTCLVISAAETLGEEEGIIAIATGRCHLEGEPGPRRSVESEEHAEYVYLEVSDSRCGIDEEPRARAFESFHSATFMGGGLGISAVERIVRCHGGILQVRRASGNHSCFRVLFPPSTGLAIKPMCAVRSPSSWHGQGTVLVVDDEEPVRKVAAALVASLGFAVLPAEHGMEAIKKVGERSEVRIVLLDLTMPGMDGEQTLHALQRVAPMLPVVLMSGYSERELSERFEGKGVAGYLKKPFTRDQLIQRLREVLGE
jgi:CheY-like chemotaxis protein